MWTPRMTTRRWMAIILVMGLLLFGIASGVKLWRRRTYFRGRAQYHAEMEFLCKEQYQNAISFFSSSSIFVDELVADERRGIPRGSQLEQVRRLVDQMQQNSSGLADETNYHRAMVRNTNMLPAILGSPSRTKE